MHRKDIGSINFDVKLNKSIQKRGKLYIGTRFVCDITIQTIYSMLHSDFPHFRCLYVLFLAINAWMYILDLFISAKVFDLLSIKKNKAGSVTYLSAQWTRKSAKSYLFYFAFKCGDHEITFGFSFEAIVLQPFWSFAIILKP